MLSEIKLQPTQPFNNLENSVTTFHLIHCIFIQMLYYLICYSLACCCYQGEEVFFYQQVAVGLKVTETYWVFELNAFDLGMVWAVF